LEHQQHTGIHLRACDSDFVQELCQDLIIFDNKPLSESSKSSFHDYCLSSNELIQFKNDEGDILNTTNENKVFGRNDISIKYYQDQIAVECYCLESEIAMLDLKSDIFQIRLRLATKMLIGLDSVNYKENVITDYTIMSVHPIGSAETIYNIEIENYNGESILQDTATSLIDFHEVITLNESNFHNVYNNTTYQSLDSLIVYFNLEYGIVGVIDSSNELWSREK